MVKYEQLDAMQSIL